MKNKTVTKLTIRQFSILVISGLMPTLFGLAYFDWPSISGITYMILVPAFTLGASIRVMFGKQDKDWAYDGLKDNKNANN
tara:strand:- start:311 stop:550 length:240 start_codon:yes stop_codon:yes gene_type:complete